MSLCSQNEDDVVVARFVQSFTDIFLPAGLPVFPLSSSLSSLSSLSSVPPSFLPCFAPNYASALPKRASLSSFTCQAEIS